MAISQVHRKYIFGHDGSNEYWVIADTANLAVRVAKTKFPSRFHEVLGIKEVTNEDFVHPFRWAN